MPAAPQNQYWHLLVANLGCVSCAAKMEAKIRNLPGIVRADLDFAAGQLRLELAPGILQKEILPAVDQIIHFVEKDAHLVLKQPTRSNWLESLPWLRLLRFGTGLLPFIGALMLPGGHFFRLPLFLAAYLILGSDVLLAAFTRIGHKQLFDENFLMSLATLGALLIGEYPEAVAVMLFYQIGEICQHLAVDHSRRSIKALLDIRPEQANLITKQGLTLVHPDQVKPGDRLQIRPGERVPLDSRIILGQSALDTAALTGESLPRPVDPGDEILAGCINGSGLLTVEVLHSYGDSAVSKILAMVEAASARKASVEQFITRFAAIYTPLMVGLALLLALLPPLFLHQPIMDWIYRALILLVISCPCALVLSVPLGYFGGLGAASSRGILVKGGNFLEKLATAGTVAFDKTGTLTSGQFVVDHIQAAGMEANEILRLSALAESFSSHPIAQSILMAWQSTGAELPDQKRVRQYQDLAGRGVSAELEDCRLLLGNSRLMKENQVLLPEFDEKAGADATILYLAIDGVYAGEIWLSDQLKVGAIGALSKLRKIGVGQLAIISGDRQHIVRQVAGKLGIEQIFAELLPEQKVAALETLIVRQNRKNSVIYVGDGINDAPVLARSDVGIALGAGSDAAIESADVVILSDDLDKISEVICLARKTSRIIRQNVFLALGLKAAVLILAVAGFAGIWQAVFADVGVAILAVFNSLRVLSRK